MKNLILGLSLSVAFILGCVYGSATTQPTPTALARAGGYTGVKWEYKCFSSGNTEDTQSASNKLGAAGFELVAAGNRYAHESIWCFKRRLP